MKTEQDGAEDEKAE